MDGKQRESSQKEHSRQEKSHGQHTGQQGRPAVAHAKADDENEDFRLIVRIANTDLDGKKNVAMALTKIRGIGIRTAKNISTAFVKATGLPATEKMGNVSEEQARKLEEIVLNPRDSGIPAWSLNRRKDMNSGKDIHLVMADLDFSLRTDLQGMNEIKSYKGLRHSWGLPVRGQKTKSTHRGKGGVIGVLKKDAKAAAAAPAKGKAAPAAAPAKTGAKGK